MAPKPTNYTQRFETVGDLYYRHSGRLRPGKSEPMVTNRDSSDPENKAAFDEWMATLCFGAALDRIAELEAKIERLESEDDGLPACINPACDRVAAFCVECNKSDHCHDVANGNMKAWRSGWYAGSDGEALADNPFATQEDFDADKEDPRIVGYPR